MASRKQNASAAKINYDQAQARFNRLNLELQQNPDDEKALAAYRDSKTKLAHARTVWRTWRIENPGENDAIAKPPTIAASAAVRKGN